MLELLRRIHRGEGGQALIMMILAMTLVFLVGVLVVDFGFWFSGRASVVNATDQATMSGSLKLPSDGAGATADAIAYLQENDSDVAVGDIGITFRCIVGDRDGNGAPDSVDITVNCPQVAPAAFTVCADGICYANCTFTGTNPKCNTIVASGEKDVPFGFGRVFGLGSGNAAGFTSAACRGACGAAPTVPLDIVMILDRSGSMTSTDLTNAKNGAKEVLKIFDPAIQHVALGVLGPSSTTSQCSGSNSPALGLAASSGGTWLPVPLLPSDYSDGNGNLNNNSLIVKTINCLNTSSVGTDLGDPLKAAMDYLVASGRPDVKKGIILLTDGAANRPLGVPGLTGEQFCINQAFVPNPNNGDGNGYEGDLTHPSSNACANDGNSTMDSNSGTSGSSTSCSPPSTTKDKHRFSNFNISIPSSPTPTIDGIDVRLDAWATSGASTRRLCARLSWNAGTNWTGYQQVDLSGTTEATYHLGGFDVNWGRTWSLSDLSNPNFLVEVTDVASNTSTTFNLDAVAVNIAYHTPNSSLSGPCDYAATQADAARAAGIELFTIGYGVSGDRCVDDGSGSRFENAPTTRLLAWMATGATPTADDGGDGPGGLQGGCAGPTEITSENADGDNFLCEARGSDLVPLFRAAAEALASGSRLVKIPF